MKKKKKTRDIILNHSQGQEKKFQQDDSIAFVQLIDFLVDGKNLNTSELFTIIRLICLTLIDKLANLAGGPYYNNKSKLIQESFLDNNLFNVILKTPFTLACAIPGLQHIFF